MKKYLLDSENHLVLHEIHEKNNYKIYLHHSSLIIHHSFSVPWYSVGNW